MSYVENVLYQIAFEKCRKAAKITNYMIKRRKIFGRNIVATKHLEALEEVVVDAHRCITALQLQRKADKSK